jgi:hypothetical protein
MLRAICTKEDHILPAGDSACHIQLSFKSASELGAFPKYANPGGALARHSNTICRCASNPNKRLAYANDTSP